MAAGVGEDGKAGGNEDDGEGGQAVKAVGKVHGVGSADDGQITQHHKADHAKRQGNLLEEGDDQDIVGRIFGKKKQGQSGNHGHTRLPHHFEFGGHAVGVFIDHFAPVVVKTERACSKQYAQENPDIRVRPVAPQQRGHGDGGQDQRTAHGRRAVFDKVGLRPVGTDSLADFEFGQFAYGPRAEQ